MAADRLRAGAAGPAAARPEDPPRLPERIGPGPERAGAAGPRLALAALLALLALAALAGPAGTPSGLALRDLGGGHCALEGGLWDGEALAALVQRLESSGCCDAVYVGGIQPLPWGGLRFRIDVHAASCQGVQAIT